MTTDAELASKARKGDDQAITELLHRYQNKIFGYLYNILKNRQDAEEVTQETFLKAINGLHSYKEEGYFKSWLFRIAYREGLKCIRKRKHIFKQIDGDMPEIADQSLNPHAELASKERIKQIETAINHLPEDEKQVVLLRAYSGIKFREISEIMDCPLNTTLGRMRNATTRLRKLL